MSPLTRSVKVRENLRLAYFSPLPPARTGIADYSAELLPYLAENSDLTAFVEEPDLARRNFTQLLPLKPMSVYPADRWNYDLAIYHIGNSGPNHRTIYEMALRYPGIVVLHDYFLHHFIAYRTVGHNDHPAYERELGYALGVEGYNLAWDIRTGHRSMPEYELPLCDRLLDRSLGVIVHSQDVAGKIKTHQEQQSRSRQRFAIGVVPAEIASIQGRSRRKLLNIDEETVVFASLGLVNATKKLDLSLEAFARLRLKFPSARYLIVGDVHTDVKLSVLIKRFGLQGVVHHTGFVATLQDFVDWTATADVVVNLRDPTLGETSASALRALATGRPVIVYDHGWYSELPDEVSLKVAPNDVEALYQAMLSLAESPVLREKMGRDARSYASRHHHPAVVARKYLQYLSGYLDTL